MSYICFEVTSRGKTYTLQSSPQAESVQVCLCLPYNHLRPRQSQSQHTSPHHPQYYSPTEPLTAYSPGNGQRQPAYMYPLLSVSLQNNSQPVTTGVSPQCPDRHVLGKDLLPVNSRKSLVSTVPVAVRF